jgi:hypothetical protein
MCNRLSRVRRLVLLVSLYLLVAVAAPAQDKGQSSDSKTADPKKAEPPLFRAGAATSNITPKLGCILVGGFGQPRGTFVHDELRVRCLVLDDGRTKIAFAICDNIGIDRSVYDNARRMIAKETGIPGDNILMAGTHTHSGPSWRGSGDDGDYPEFLARRIADGIARAVHNLEPARIGWGVGKEPGQVFNRRWKMKPGPWLVNPFGKTDQVRMNPGHSEHLLEPAGPVDPDITFLTVQSKTGRPIALLANYSLHYVGGVPGHHISADYFAAFADRIQQLLGADRLDPPFVGIMSNGTSGDVNNNNYSVPFTERRQPYEQIQRVARIVAAEVERVHQTVRFQDWVPLGAQVKEIAIANRKPDDELIAWAQATLAKPEDAPKTHPLERHYAQRVLSLRERPDHQEIMLQTLRVGDVGVTAIPFEVFAEIGLELKKRSPFKPTFNVSIANGYDGYLPTPAQHKVGGYETWLGTNRVEIDASVKITEGLLDLFRRLQK